MYIFLHYHIIAGKWSDEFYDCRLIDVGACPADKSASEQNQHIASMFTASLTNIVLLVCCGILIVIYIVLIDVSLPRLYHMVQEVTLLVSLLIIMPARSPTLFDAAAFCNPDNPDFEPPSLSTDQCTMVSILMHYVSTVHFLSLLLEAIHNYTYFTHVFNEKSCTGRIVFLLTVLGLPLIFVVPPPFFMWNDYTTKNTCWVNYEKPISLIILIPIAAMAFTSIILAEATTMVRYPHHMASDEKMKTSAATNSKGSLIVTCLSFFSYACTTFAVYSVDMTLYMASSILNTTLGIMLIMWHTLGNEKARKLMLKICPCCKKKEDPPPPTPVDDGADVVE